MSAGDGGRGSGGGGGDSRRGRKKGARESEGEKKDHSRPSSTLRIAFLRSTRDLMGILDCMIDKGTVVVSLFVRILGPCMILLAHCLIGFVVYVYFMVALPIMESPATELGRYTLGAPGLFLVLNALYNYWRTICGDSGTPPTYHQPADDDVDPSDEEAMFELIKRENGMAPEQKNGKPSLYKECKKCGRQKPPRAHHCSICRRCVLKMDHHCPWVNNCVGFGNYRNFCLFMLFLWLSCLYAAALFMYGFTDVLLHMRMGRRLPGTRGARSLILTSFMVCMSIVIAVSMLGGFHLYLVLTNQTTIEFQINMVKRREARKNAEYYRNPYDLGRTRNFQQVFGPNRFLRLRWMFPYLALPPGGDGFEFQSLRAGARSAK